MARILVVDDDENVRVTLAALLDRLGHEVEAYDDARPAMDRADFARLDLVIVDLAMPTPGEELVEMIRQSGHDMPILVISGYLEERDRADLEALGVTRILAKPFMPTELMTVVDLFLGPAV